MNNRKRAKTTRCETDAIMIQMRGENAETMDAYGDETVQEMQENETRKMTDRKCDMEI